MTASEKRKMQLLLVIVALLGLSLYYNSHPTNPIPPLSLPNPEVRSERLPVLQSVSQPDNLPSLTMLKKEAPVFTESSRNLFQFTDEGPAPTDLAMNDPGNPAGLNPETETSPESEPGTEITFVGFYREKQNPQSLLAIISVSGKVQVARQGDAVANGYHVVKIQDNLLILSNDTDHSLLRYSLGKTASLR